MLKPSQGMQWQIAQTKARIGAGIYAICVKTTILVWLIGTVVIVWLRIDTSLPQLHHVYFTQWVVAGLLDKIPYLNTRLNLYGRLPISHQWYAWRPALDWLNSGEVYHHSFPAYCWHFGRWIGLDLLGVWAVVIVASTLRGRRDVELIRGMELLSARQHAARLHGRWFRRLYRRASQDHPTTPRGIRIGQVAIPPRLENQGFLITGSTGSGKSTVERHMLYQVQERRQPAVVLDPDCEFVQEFYRKERGDYILNPLDARMDFFWSPWLELGQQTFKIDAENLAASFVREQPPSTRDNPFFKDSSRSLFEATLQHLREKYGDDASSAHIADFLALDRKDIADALPWFPNIDPDAHDQGSGIVSTCFNAVKPLRHLPSREHTSRTWSAREWARDPQGSWIFLTSEANTRIATQKLQGVWLDLLVRCLMSRPIGSERVWIFADELASFGRQNEIVEASTRGRKREISLVIGFQNVSQLNDTYGRDTAITLVSSPTTKIILRCDESETAKWASDLIGNREITRPQMTSLAGVSGMREGMNITSHRSTEPIVMPAQIQLLKELHGYLCIAGYPRCEITIPERHLEKRVPAFVTRSAATTAGVASSQAANATGSQFLRSTANPQPQRRRQADLEDLEN